MKLNQVFHSFSFAYYYLSFYRRNQNLLDCDRIVVKKLFLTIVTITFPDAVVALGIVANQEIVMMLARVSCCY